jgi:hypothetical protein
MQIPAATVMTTEDARKGCSEMDRMPQHPVRAHHRRRSCPGIPMDAGNAQWFFDRLGKALLIPALVDSALRKGSLKASLPKLKSVEA